MSQNRFYSSVAAKTTLVGTINASVTTLAVASVTGFPASLPFTLILERDTANEEVVTVTGVSTLTLTVTRAQDGTTGVSHTTGAVVEHGVSARDFNEPQAHIAATGAVHGLSGSIVGTTDAQTLSNKTLTSPALSTPTITGVTTGPGWSADGSGNILGANLTNGVLNCTSATRPGAPRTGQYILETDTKRVYVYNGTAWVPSVDGLDVGNTTFTPQASTAGTWVTSTTNGHYRIVNGIYYGWGYASGYSSGGTNNNFDVFWGGPSPAGSIQVGQIIGTGQILGASRQAFWIPGTVGQIHAFVVNDAGNGISFQPVAGDGFTYQLCYPVV